MLERELLLRKSLCGVPRTTLSMGLELESLSGSGIGRLHSAVGQSCIYEGLCSGHPRRADNMSTSLVGFGLLLGLVQVLLISQSTETLTKNMN